MLFYYKINGTTHDKLACRSVLKKKMKLYMQSKYDTAFKNNNLHKIL